MPPIRKDRVDAQLQVLARENFPPWALTELQTRLRSDKVPTSDLKEANRLVNGYRGQPREVQAALFELSGEISRSLRQSLPTRLDFLAAEVSFTVQQAALTVKGHFNNLLAGLASKL